MKDTIFFALAFIISFIAMTQVESFGLKSALGMVMVISGIMTGISIYFGINRKY